MRLHCTSCIDVAYIIICAPEICEKCIVFRKCILMTTAHMFALLPNTIFYAREHSAGKKNRIAFTVNE